jgi:hypothetical protein
MDGEVLGMNFYDRRIGTPFLFWSDIDNILSHFRGKRYAYVHYFFFPNFSYSTCEVFEVSVKDSCVLELITSLAVFSQLQTTKPFGLPMFLSIYLISPVTLINDSKPFGFPPIMCTCWGEHFNKKLAELSRFSTEA